MSETLTDPDKPAHAIVGTRDDGSPLRNDGVPLQPANQNPWYVLATVYGEYRNTPPNLDMVSLLHREYKLYTDNRRAWNGWFCQNLTDEEICNLVKEFKLNEEVVKRLSIDELITIEKMFENRMGKGKTLPKRRNEYCVEEEPELGQEWCAEEFDYTWFPRPVYFDGFLFDNSISFDNSVFSDEMDFSKTHFFGGASFKNTTFNKSISFTESAFLMDPALRSESCGAHFSNASFLENVGFDRVKFHGLLNMDNAVFEGKTQFRGTLFSAASFCKSKFVTDANFGWEQFSTVTGQLEKTAGKARIPTKFRDNLDFSFTVFEGKTNFHSVVFNGKVDFISSSFMSFASFSSSKFSGSAVFSSVKFKSTTSFKEARFLTHVQEFNETELYDGTDFTLPEDFRENWPPLHGDGIMPADKQKKAYNRLRLFMNKSMQIDEEQFFHRMEMRCKHVLASKPHKPIYWVFDKLSEYGSSVTRPLIGLLFLIMVGWPLMLVHLEMRDPATGAQFWTSLGWSISNSLPFLGLGKVYLGDVIRDLPGWLKYVGGLQTFCGFILLFFLGLGLRNRFRLR
jgi:hypothetical protein